MVTRINAVSSCVILVRPSSHNDFEMFYIKRSPDLFLAGGKYAYPGGRVEEQDFYEVWEEVFPQYMKEVGQYYHDFNKRIACIRELAEETNLFLLKDKKGGLPKDLTLEQMNTTYKDRFAHFCKDFGVLPQIE